METDDIFTYEELVAEEKAIGTSRKHAVKINILLAALIFFASACVYAQRDTLYLDSLSGDYVVRYWRTFAYASDSAGLHLLEYDDMIGKGQEYVEKDSFVTVIFEPATKIEPKITCTVTKEDGGTSYVYMYQVENGSKARQRIVEFEFGYGKGAKPVDRTPKDSWQSHQMYELGGDGLMERNLRAWWDKRGLDPGGGKVSVGFMSVGMPGIVSASFRGKAPSVGIPGSSKYEFRLRILALRSLERNCVKESSLGPVLIPKSLDHMVFLDSLISYRKQCVSLGWISNDSVARSLDGKLRILRRDVANRKYTSAVAVLRSLSRELDVHRSRSISEEAYALFKYNVEYLSDQLVKAR